MGGETDHSAETAVITSELHATRGPTIVGVFIMSAVLVFVMAAIRPLAVDPWLIDLWAAAMALLLCAVVGLVATGSLRSTTARSVAPYARVARIFQTSMSMLIVASVWVLLPPSGPELRALMLMMYVWYIATLIAASGAAAPVPARDIVLLTSSTLAWVLWDRPPYWGAWAIFLAMAGATMLVFSKFIRRAVVAAITARVASENAEAATQAALGAAEAARDAKTRFIASASHDLQQPLLAARLFFEDAIKGGSAEAQARAIDGARQAFASTSALIGVMIDHLRLEAGAIRARPELVALGPLLREITAEHAPSAHAAGVQLRVIETRRVAVADPGLLRRALGNLVSNAIRHAQAERILVGVRGKQGSVALWVIDDGRGISADESSMLFEEYHQGSSAAPGGFGLGLVSVRRSLGLMGGEAGFEPRWTGGAAFWLHLPCPESAS